MTTVRTKFAVLENKEITLAIDPAKEGGETHHSVSLYAVYAGSPENEQFFRYTPAGTIMLNVVREQTAALFPVGAEFYVDLIPVKQDA